VRFGGRQLVGGSQEDGTMEKPFNTDRAVRQFVKLAGKRGIRRSVAVEKLGLNLYQWQKVSKFAVGAGLVRLEGHGGSACYYGR
jgi:hypothetical protein